MEVQFIFPDGQTVEYGWPAASAPAAGDIVYFDGSDPDVPAGVWEVKPSGRRFDVGLRGPKRVRCRLVHGDG